MFSETKTTRKILRCIDEGLEILGSSGKKAVYYHLENKMGIRKREICEKPEVFLDGLQLIFGKEGMELIERSLVQKLARAFNLKTRSRIGFVEALELINSTKIN